MSADTALAVTSTPAPASTPPRKIPPYTSPPPIARPLTQEEAIIDANRIAAIRAEAESKARWEREQARRQEEKKAAAAKARAEAAKPDFDKILNAQLESFANSPAYAEWEKTIATLTTAEHALAVATTRVQEAEMEFDHTPTYANHQAVEDAEREKGRRDSYFHRLQSRQRHHETKLISDFRDHVRSVPADNKATAEVHEAIADTIDKIVRKWLNLGVHESYESQRERQLTDLEFQRKMQNR